MFLQYYYASNHVAVEDVFALVWQAVTEQCSSKWVSTNRDKKQLALKNLLVNLMACPVMSNEDPPCVVASRSKDHYRTRQYQACHFKYSVYVPLIDVLVTEGWCEEKRGFYDRKTGVRKRTRLYPTERLRQYGELHLQHLWNDNPNLLELRDRHKCPSAYQPDSFTKQLANGLRRYNDFISTIPLSLPMKETRKEERGRAPYSHNSVDLAASDRNCEDFDGRALRLRRIFNGDFQNGGRHYGIYQSLPQKERLRLRLNGLPVVELDFQAMHPTMLYHQAKLRAPDNCYGVFRDERDVGLRPAIKLAFQIMLNAKSPKAMLAALHNKSVKMNGASRPVSDLLAEHEVAAGDLVRAIQQKHEPIADRFFSEAGLTLQFVDSQIMAQILDKCCQANIPALAIHDSIIVPRARERDAKGIMHEAYRGQLGDSIAVTRQESDDVG